jgi:fucose 4-O-acetylase-like acetyltransferase
MYRVYVVHACVCMCVCVCVCMLVMESFLNGTRLAQAQEGQSLNVPVLSFPRSARYSTILIQCWATAATTPSQP